MTINAIHGGKKKKQITQSSKTAPTKLIFLGKSREREGNALPLSFLHAPVPSKYVLQEDSVLTYMSLILK